VELVNWKAQRVRAHLPVRVLQRVYYGTGREVSISLTNALYGLVELF
jgi:hypothetical protein